MSGGELFMGIDVGTSAVKAAIVDRGGRVLAVASAAYPTEYLRPTWAEQDPEKWWTATCQVIAGVLAQISTAGKSAVSGIGISAQAPTLLPLNAAGKPLRQAMIWMDRRSDAQSLAMIAELGESNIMAMTANRSDPFFVAPKLRWLRDNEPEVLESAASFVQINGYLAYRLTGELSLDPQHASLLGLRDAESGSWSDKLLDAVGVRAAQFPEVVPATSIIGAVTARAADQTGLPVGTPVVAGTVDSSAAALEAGVTQVGQAAEMTGTSTVVVLPTSRPLLDGAFITMSSPLPNQWLSLAAMVATGASLEWLRTLTGTTSGHSEMAESASRVKPGADGVIFLPYMMGERSPIWDSNARGVLVGLTLASGPAELTRAVLEGTAFALRHNLEVAADSGLVVSELRSLGGPSRNDTWCQIKADITGVPISRMKSGTGATFGDAALAAVGTGYSSDLAGFGSETRIVDRMFEPRTGHVDTYTAYYESYLRTYTSLKDEFTALTQAMELGKQ